GAYRHAADGAWFAGDGTEDAAGDQATRRVAPRVEGRASFRVMSALLRVAQSNNADGSLGYLNAGDAAEIGRHVAIEELADAHVNVRSWIAHHHVIKVIAAPDSGSQQSADLNVVGRHRVADDVQAASTADRP